MPATRGTIESCACPHCKHPMAFTDEIEFLEKGTSFFCDHCKKKFWLADIRRPTIILLTTQEPR